MFPRSLGLCALALLVTAGPVLAERAASLRGSPAGMQEQNRVARDFGLAFYRTNGEIQAAVASGDLIRLEGNEDYDVANFVDLPYLHSAAHLFVERLARQYREGCGQKLVVTSAVRATSQQPANAHALSVHPAGMAVDLRVSDRAECRRWLEDALLGMEARGLINGIREYHPPHYHVAVYPAEYLAYALERAAQEAEQRLASAREDTAVADPTGVRIPAMAVTLVADGYAPPGGGNGGMPLIAGIAAAGLALPFGIGYLLRRRRR